MSKGIASKRTLLYLFLSITIVISVFFLSDYSLTRILSFQDIFSTFSGTSFIDKSANIRQTLVFIGFNNFIENPWFGTGLGTFSMFGLTINDISLPPHNVYIGFLSDTGITGFIGFLIYLFYPIYTYISRGKFIEQSSASKTVMCGYLASLLYFVFYDGFLSLTFAMLWGLAVQASIV